MRNLVQRGGWTAVPLVASLALVLAACGSGDGDKATVSQPAAAPDAAAEVPVAPAEAPAETSEAVQAVDGAAGTATKTQSAKSETVQGKATSTKPAKAARSAVAAKAGKPAAKAPAAAAEDVEGQRISDAKNGATDIGVTKDTIKLGAINMHGMALGNVLIGPIVRGMLGTFSSINDRGGILGRRMMFVDCDDGPGEVSRAKACIKKLAGNDKIFSLLGGASWATASIHDDLKQYKLPYVGAWAYSQTEWQDPYMFPTHMSMIHEAMAGANWAKDVIKPKTYGLICLTSPEMQLACNEVAKIMDASGSKMVKRADVSISETSMSAYVLAMRAANPDHIIHYVINPATIAKFIVEAAQQNYYPPKGISGNHLAGELVGSLLGKYPTGRYWTNTTYKLWGTEFIGTMDKYAKGNKGINHHIVQAGYVGANIFAQAAKEVGPNLTRERLMAQLGNGTVYASDASLDQRFAWIRSERYGSNWNPNYGQGREFMYKYNTVNTISNPDGSPNGWVPDPDKFVIYTFK